MTGCDHCPLEEYVNGEDDIPVCLDACSDTWEEKFFDNLGQEDQGEDEDEEDSDNEQPSPEFEPPQLKSYKEAIMSLEDIQLFLESQGCLQMQVVNFMDNLSAVQIATAKQTTLHDFI